jgi:hypothetical protein
MCADARVSSEAWKKKGGEYTVFAFSKTTWLKSNTLILDPNFGFGFDFSVKNKRSIEYSAFVPVP